MATIHITQNGRTGTYDDANSLRISDLSAIEAFTFYPYDRGEKAEIRITVRDFARISSISGREVYIETARDIEPEPVDIVAHLNEAHGYTIPTDHTLPEWQRATLRREHDTKHAR